MTLSTDLAPPHVQGRALGDGRAALVGRDREQAEIDRILSTVRGGFSAGLVVRGEAGIGKTALLDYAMTSAADLRVTRVTGVESEVELGFSGLHQLLRPFLALMPLLPRPQRQALAVALGQAEGATPDRFLVGLAALTLLSGAAAEQSLLCVMDDVQWLDQASAEVLAFVARRCEADPIGFLFAVRQPGDRSIALEGLGSLTLDALDAVESRRLLATLVPSAMDGRVAAQLQKSAAGNPLALVELTRELTREQLAGSAWLPDPLPIGADLQTRFVRRIAGLPTESRTLLLLASAEPSGDLALFERAARHLGVDGFREDCSRCDDLLEVGDHVVFRHPLIRSAAYRGATPGARRRAHAAIAMASDPQADADRVAWHRAAAASGPDEAAAVALERSADRASRRGGAVASASLLRRSAELTPDPGLAAKRLVAAATAEFRGGGTLRTLVLLDRAEPGLPDDVARAAALHLRGSVHFALGHGRQSTEALLRRAELLMPVAPEQARESLLEALIAALYAGVTLRDHVLGVVRRLAGPPPGHPAISDLLLDGFIALLVDGPAAGAPFLRSAIARLLADDVQESDELRWLGIGMWACNELFDWDSHQAMARRWVGLCRERGALTVLPLALDFLSYWQASHGQLAAAESANAEGRGILAATGNPDMLGTRAAEVVLPVWRGEECAAREAAGALMTYCAEREQLGGVYFGHQALCVLELSLCNYPAALAHARALLDDNGPAFGALILADAVEAAVRCGDRETAALAVDRLARRAEAAADGLAPALLARCRALVTPDADADVFFREATNRLSGSTAVSELARTHLLHGEWLRRQRRRAEARTQLRTAHEIFQRIGAERFAERAWSELSATGEKARRRTTQSATSLTAREAQIAELVVDGARNAEVAAQLFISPSTVEYHLRHIFQKRGVTSRTKLAAAMRDQHDRV